MRPIVNSCRTQGIRLVCYSDEFLVMAQPEKIREHKGKVLTTLLQLGWSINWDKSHLQPDHTREFIGFVIQTDQERIRPTVIKIPGERIRKVRKDIRRALATSTPITARHLARICGQCVAMARVIAPGKLLLRSAYRLLGTRTTWESRLTLDDPTRRDLRWWLEALGPDGWNAAEIKVTAVEAQIETDASDSGWGAFYDGHQAAGFWNTRMRTRSINYRELMAVLLGLKSFAPQLRGKSVQILSDNITAVAYINHLGGPSADLTALAESLWITANDFGITLQASHLAGGLNSRADRLSRLPPAYEWRLHPNLFLWINRCHGPFTIDRFATMCNAQLPLFNSYKWDPLSSGIDALAQQDWAEHNNYVNPPFCLIPRILDTISAQRATATIIAPWWPGQPWLQRLQQLSVTPPIRIPKSTNTLQCTAATAEPLRNPRWRLYAWRISGNRD